MYLACSNNGIENSGKAYNSLVEFYKDEPVWGTISSTE